MVPLACSEPERVTILPLHEECHFLGFPYPQPAKNIVLRFSRLETKVAAITASARK
jgi:hypothetical protein